MRIGVLLQRYRAEHHLTVRELADRLDLTEAEIWALIDDVAADQQEAGVLGNLLQLEIMQASDLARSGPAHPEPADVSPADVSPMLAAARGS